jgi:predicted transposase/invertase (TIGR01784 family)
MMIHQFLDPKNDVAFKKIFGTEKNKDILIQFLNDMVVFKSKEKIQDIQFLKTVQDPEIAAKKTSVLDVLCKDQNGHSYIVEMQVAKTKGFEKRAQFYASKVYCSQSNSGDQYHDLKEVIFLAIIDGVLFPNKKAYKSDHMILGLETNENDLRDFSFTFLELGKFNKTKQELGSLSSLVEKWSYFFKYAEQLSESEINELMSQEGMIQRAYKELDRFYWNESELIDYDTMIKKEKDYVASMDQKFDEGLAKGIKMGKREEKMDIARALLKSGLSKDLVCSVTGLSAEDLIHLK